MTSVAAGMPCASSAVSGAVQAGALGASGRGSVFGRSKSVGVGERVSNLLFGSPSARGAFGLCRADAAGRSAGKGCARGRHAASAAAPVFALDFSKATKRGALPRIWVSEPVWDERAGRCCGREVTASYPCDGDENGSKAFALGMGCFGEGLSYSRAEDSAVRVECFRAAEMLFLHAAARGSMEAHEALGSLYEGDLCEGSYFGLLSGEGAPSACCLDAKAVEHFAHAAARGSAEACVRLGEMAAAGRGCEQDERRALDLYVRGFGLADAAGDASVGGNAALLIAQAYEQGVGCEQSFKRAYAWYRIAEDELAYVVDEGAWRFRRPRAKAVMGVKRMRQELVGGY